MITGASTDYSFFINRYGFKGVEKGFDRVWFREKLANSLQANMCIVSDEYQGLDQLLRLASHIGVKGIKRGYHDWFFDWNKKVCQEAWQRSTREVPNWQEFVQYEKFNCKSG